MKIISLSILLSALFIMSSAGQISAQNPIPGDLNHDGKVDIFDYNTLVTNYGKTVCGNVADINLDCKVDIFDYNILVTNYGRISTTVTPTITPPSSGVPCSSLTGIERRFPCSPLTVGTMPESVSSGTDKWDMFTNILYPGLSDNDGINERFSAVTNPSGIGVVVRNQNVVADSEGHTTVGTGRSLPLGSTECSAFRWLWKSQAEFPQVDWVLVWQLQMSGSPIVAVHTDAVGRYWYFKSRNGSDNGTDIRLGDIIWGRWAYFVVCTHLAEAPGGWTKIWFRNDGWPDVNAAPFYQRSGHDTYQGETGHNTIGIYAGGSDPAAVYYGYFDRYGRATTPARAIQIAGNP